MLQGASPSRILFRSISMFMMIKIGVRCYGGDIWNMHVCRQDGNVVEALYNSRDHSCIFVYANVRRLRGLDLREDRKVLHLKY